MYNKRHFHVAIFRVMSFTSEQYNSVRKTGPMYLPELQPWQKLQALVYVLAC